MRDRMLRRRLPEGSRESSPVGRVAGVLIILQTFLVQPPGVDVLEGGKLTSNNVAAVRTTLCRALRIASGAVSNQAVMQAGQDALHSAGVEGSEDYIVYEQCSVN